MTAMSDQDSVEARLEVALKALPQATAPRRDLWPEIESRLAGPVRESARWRRAWSIAAAVLLIAASSLVTAVLMSRGPRPAPAVAVTRGAELRGMPVAFGPGHTLSPAYQADRRQLSAVLQERLARMPPAARQRLEANLQELRRAANEINGALEQAPGDPLLQELLLDTYQDELAVLAAVNQLTSANSAGAPADIKGMPL
ncbi:MAG TPA: hypothetical protein VMT50_11915 [Steroidobacteraceae bacterium]|nr:hypothetical protein [Steroidobacteraceae bacterium]